MPVGVHTRRLGARAAVRKPLQYSALYKHVYALAWSGDLQDGAKVAREIYDALPWWAWRRRRNSGAFLVLLTLAIDCYNAGFAHAPVPGDRRR